MSERDDGTWAGCLAAGIGGRVAALRRARGLSAEHLAQRMQEAGVAASRSVIANLESGRRPTISVAEVFLISAILDSSPRRLLFPADAAEYVEITPGRTVPTVEAIAWMAGTSLDEESVQDLRDAAQFMDDAAAALREALSRLRAIPDPSSDPR